MTPGKGEVVLPQTDVVHVVTIIERELIEQQGEEKSNPALKVNIEHLGEKNEGVIKPIRITIIEDEE